VKQLLDSPFEKEIETIVRLAKIQGEKIAETTIRLLI